MPPCRKSASCRSVCAAAKGSRTSGRLLVKPAVAAAVGGPERSAAPGAPGRSGRSRRRCWRSRMEFSPGGGGPNSGPMTEEQEKAYLLSGRYLDAEGKPIPFGGGGAARSGRPAAPAPAADPAAAGQPLDLTVFGQEYKRLPVRMALRMDQRWLPRLIAECASQPLQVEVQEVRINPPEGIGSTSRRARRRFPYGRRRSRR